MWRSRSWCLKYTKRRNKMVMVILMVTTTTQSKIAWIIMNFHAHVNQERIQNKQTNARKTVMVGVHRYPKISVNCINFPNLSLFIYYFILFLFVCFVMNVACLPTPPKGQVVSVRPMHVLAHDHIYVHFTDYSKQFNDVQFNMLQKIRPKPLNCVPST